MYTINTTVDNIYNVECWYVILFVLFLLQNIKIISHKYTSIKIFLCCYLV